MTCTVLYMLVNPVVSLAKEAKESATGARLVMDVLSCLKNNLQE